MWISTARLIVAAIVAFGFAMLQMRDWPPLKVAWTRPLSSFHHLPYLSRCRSGARATASNEMEDAEQTWGKRLCTLSHDRRKPFACPMS